jgi:hypothetical protein
MDWFIGLVTIISQVVGGPRVVVHPLEAAVRTDPPVAAEAAVKTPCIEVVALGKGC